MSKKMYVLTRRDLTKSQQAVQAGHALAQYLIDYSDNPWTNGTLVYLGVGCEDSLLGWMSQVVKRDIKCSGFEEPDLDHEITAFAAYDEDGRLEELFGNLELL